MKNDDELLIDLRRRAADPSTRTDVRNVQPPLLQPPVTPEMIATTEAQLRFALHPLLKRIYAEVANGGFGPGYGLLRLSAHDEDLGQQSLSSVYREFRDGGWPEKVLPLWDWGDAAWSCLDASSSEGTIVTHDDVVGATETAFTLRSWLSAWVAGINLWNEIYEDKEATLTNPFTNKPVKTKVYGFAKGKKRG